MAALLLLAVHGFATKLRRELLCQEGAPEPPAGRLRLSENAVLRAHQLSPSLLVAPNLPAAQSPDGPVAELSV